MNHDTENEEIFIPPDNRMKAKYTLYAVDNSEVFTEVEVSQDENSSILTEIAVKVNERSDKNTEIDIKYRGNSDVFVEIQPIGFNGISVEIEVPPHNKMWALFEVQEPPRITAIKNPFQDSFTREKSQFQAINYGQNNSLVVGRSEDDIYRSYIQFDFGEWSPHFIIVESKIKLYYTGTIPDNAKLEILTLNEQWYEYGITHLNRPSPINLIVDKYTINKEERYVEFTVTGLVESWLKNEVNNHGIVIRASNETKDMLVNFRARESTRPPELLITYYDANVYSGGRTQIPTEIFVWNADKSDVNTEVTVGSVIGTDIIPVEIYVHRYEVPVDSVHDIEITVSRPLILTEITISALGESSTLAELSVRSGRLDDKRDVEITVSKPKFLSEIFIKYVDDIDAEITIQRHEDSEKYAEISITREVVNSEIYIKHRHNIETEITVQRFTDDEKNAELIINRESVNVEISVSHRSDKNTEITVQKLKEEDMLTEVAITREKVEVELFVKYKNDILVELTVQREDALENEVELIVSRPLINTEINVRALVKDDTYIEVVARAIGEEEIDSTITVSRDEILTLITVVEFSTVDAELYVKHRDDKLTEIIVTIFDDVLVEIDPLPQSKISVEITVTRPDTLAQITVPYWDDSNVETELEVRILEISDVETIITVKSKGGAYVFII
ncbi:DNRLRE domain-containing protein [Sporosarcina sp. FSL W7-1283]|uniref:DNRLRE domain-containing protein n=1 Tax=Sporosarcina sp. FSL W7-1283 TaxID=2921560 RepID=UPI0030F90DB2